MATQQRPAVVDEEHEYSSLAMTSKIEGPNQMLRYEALPPNFSLSANMVAGAFAGIAV
jgi:hypothetical protein